MVDALKQRLKNIFAEGGWSAGVTLVLWLYWGVYSLLVPVAFWDSQTYNLARLEIFSAGGFWGNNLWNTERQISFPWTFDALHLPLLRIGTGAALPSFACFTGLLWIVHRLVRQRYTPRVAWFCCLGLMAMPTMVYQATSTKNDMVVLFALACWLYALLEFKRTRRAVHLVAMATSLGLAAGSKSSGIPLALVAGMISLVSIGRDFRCQHFFAAASVFSILLLGSVEIYINNVLLFGRPLGSQEFIDSHRNLDGARGASANFIRYVLGNATTGAESTRWGQKIATSTANTCREILQKLDLTDAGNRRDFHDADLVFSHSTLEGNADFGPVGTLALLSVFCALIFRQCRDRTTLLLTITALATMALISLTTAWMPWNNRFLLITMAAAVLTLMIMAGNYAPHLIRNGVMIVTIVSALQPLFISFNRKPEHIKTALTKRMVYALKENHHLYEVVSDLEKRIAAGECQQLILHAGVDSWILPFFSLSPLVVHPEPRLTGEVLSNPAYGQSHVLVLGRTLSPESQRQLILIKDYKLADTALYLLSK
jgi:hypothetical protein